MRRIKYFAAVLLTAAIFLSNHTKEIKNTETSTTNIDILEEPIFTNIDSEKENEIIEATPGNLYALSAVLMDGKTGRVLYEKSGNIARANASTTKVLTCILALENGAGDDYVKVSAKAAVQPEVRLGIKEGEQYYLEDLLFSLMLKSHNDSAVAIAEHIGGTTEKFAEMMNEKAKEIGCKDTYFITPNGLDAEDKNGEHHTTAEDLARIMRYAIKNPVFLKITQTKDYTFSDLKKTRNYALHNANAFMDMEEGVIAGKTGYTGKAGYCYVCACEKNDKQWIIALLGSGWPNNRSFKWKDSKKLLDYGENNFEYQELRTDFELPELIVENGVDEKWKYGDIFLEGRYIIPTEAKKQILLKKDQKIEYRYHFLKKISAPIKKGETIGEIIGIIGTEEVYKIPVTAEKDVCKINRKWFVEKIFHDYFHS